jgi:lysylphosphatidylglycerol synthetase-like protein (DUF2156 family)
MPEDANLRDLPAANFAGLPPAVRRKLMGRAAVRATLTLTVLTVAYFALPFTLISKASYLTAFLLGAAVVMVVLAVQARNILRSPYPRLRAVGALMTSGPLFIVLFAALHYLIAHVNPSSYTQPMTRLDALYFTVATFATVGYGDLSPVSQTARLAALVQMVCGLFLVGVIAKLLLSITQESRGRITPGPEAPSRSPRLRSSGERSR